VKQRPIPAATNSPSVGLRRYLYFTAATTGAAIMVVEILGAKMLSPFVGMSHFVWTAQIAVTLVALAAGYYAGGRLADRSQRLAQLYWAIVGAAGYLALTVLICEPIAYWALDFNLALGSLLASAILFFVPLALLAMTGPFLVRVITSSVTGVGGNVGRLTSIGTLGSFGGTLLIGYVMIPLLPNSVAMFLTAATLGLVACVYFVLVEKRWASSLASLGLLGMAGVLLAHERSRPYASMKQLFRGNSHFGELQVVDTPDGYCRFYLNDNLIQNTYDPKTHQSESSFTYVLAGLARAYSTNITDVLCIGLGVGIVPMDFATHGARVDVVEINPAVVSVATRFFDLKQERIHLTIDDGRHYLNRCHKQYDAVVLDAFLGDSSPSHLLTHEAFATIQKVLRPGGTLVINSFGHLEPGKDFFAASLNKTLRSVFQAVRMHTSGKGAVFFVAANRPTLDFVHPMDLSQVHAEAQVDVKECYSGGVEAPLQDGLILTDNYNPVEFYDAANREAIRKRLAIAAHKM
jgi:spermidine synthase